MRAPRTERNKYVAAVRELPSRKFLLLGLRTPKAFANRRAPLQDARGYNASTLQRFNGILCYFFTQCCRILIFSSRARAFPVWCLLERLRVYDYGPHYSRTNSQRVAKDPDPRVCGRISIRTNRGDRYLAERFRALPKDGDTPMFQKML